MILLIYVQDTSALSKALLHYQLRNYKEFFSNVVVVSPIEFQGYEGYDVSYRTELYPCKEGGALVSIAKDAKEPIYYLHNNYIIFENPNMIEPDSIVVSRYEIPYIVVDSKQRFAYRMRSKCISNEEVFVHHGVFKPGTLLRYCTKDVGTIEEVLEPLLSKHLIHIHRYKGKWFYIAEEKQLEALGLRT
jgi:hypothetical protein